MYVRRENKPWVLYDLKKDPYKPHNFVNDPGSIEIRKELNQRLNEWMEKTGDSWEYDWSTPLEDKGLLYKHETLYTVEELMEWAKKHPSPAGL